MAAVRQHNFNIIDKHLVILVRQVTYSAERIPLHPGALPQRIAS